MSSLAALIVLSAFAALGIYTFITTVFETFFSNRTGRVVMVVPAAETGPPLEGVLEEIKSFSVAENTVVVDMDGEMNDPGQYIEGGLCAAVVAPEEVGEAVYKIIEQ